MKFYFNDQRTKGCSDIDFPYVKLTRDQWDDYGSKTLFTAYYVDKEDSQTRIGQLKIISKNIEDYDTSGYILVDASFSHLGENFCSLGQDTEYYKTVKKLFGEDFKKFLDPLNDITINRGMIDDFEDTSVFKDSLIRFSEAEKALKEGQGILHGQELKTEFNFSFSCKVGRAEEHHLAKFNFKKSSLIPHRIFSIIGENGTGKTQYLSKLALAISGEKDQGEFEPSRPLFNKVIAVSYSAFDQFMIPKKKRSFSYRYCGLKDSNGFLSDKKIENNYRVSCDKIENKNLKLKWFFLLKTVIDENILELIHDELFESKNYLNVARNSDGLLSSGQSILMYVITEILANIREESLILFDEPEMHLHPTAISNLITLLNELLDEFDSYAILATHSPLIIQEIPSKNVLVFERIQNIPIIRNLEIESFGENITTITKNIFKTVDIEPNYKKVLSDLSKSRSYEEVLKLFDNKLSLNSEIYLKGCYKYEES